MIISKIAVYTTLEILFIILLALVFWIAALRKSNAKYKLVTDDLRETIASLKNLQKNGPHSVIHKPVQGLQHDSTHQNNAINALKIKLKRIKRELSSNRQQLSNMQQYKDLYYTLEKLLTEKESDDHDNNEERIDVLEKTLSEQEQIITEMKAQLEMQPDDKSEKYIVQLERTIGQLERSNQVLKQEIEQQESNLEVAEQRNEEIQHYRCKAMTLQTREKRLNAELISLKTELYSATEEIEKNTEKLMEFNRLKATLNEKENEIKRLKNECETLGDQYHDLAAQSLTNISNDISEEKRKEMASLRTMLKETLEELERKREECKILEQNYLDLESNGELAKATDKLESSLADRSALEISANWLSRKAIELNKENANDDLKELKTLYETKFASLSQSQEEHEKIEDKIFQLSDKTIKRTDKASEKLRCEHNKLKEKYRHLKLKTNNLADTEEKYLKLQDEYNLLEKRYLRLAQENLSQ